VSSTDTPVAAPAASAPKHRAEATPRPPRAENATSARPGRHAHVAARARRTGSRTLRAATLTGGVAAVATAVAVSGGLLAAPASVVAAAGNLAAAAPRVAPSTLMPTLSADALTARARVPVSRSDRRDAVDPDKAAALAAPGGPAVTGTESLAQEDPRVIARALLSEFGFGADEFGCLDPLWSGESGWRVSADNPSSSAYGIPQALPGSKMSSAGADWATNPVTQIRWGLGYIRDRYGSPCGAWSYKQGHGYY
jgi:hypothetical protein